VTGRGSSRDIRGPVGVVGLTKSLENLGAVGVLGLTCSTEARGGVVAVGALKMTGVRALGGVPVIGVVPVGVVSASSSYTGPGSGRLPLAKDGDATLNTGPGGGLRFTGDGPAAPYGWEPSSS